MARDAIADSSKRRRALRGLSYTGRAIIVLGLDAVIFSIFRPSSRWLSGQTFVHAAQRRVGRLPAYVILVVLALPFAIAEPAKILALYLIATGRAFIGVLILVGAYFVSLVIVERLFRGGRTKLLTIPWFKAAWQWLMAVRRRLLKRGRSTRIWASFVKTRDRVRRHAHVARFRRRSSGENPPLQAKAGHVVSCGSTRMREPPSPADANGGF
jgi:hypothetical protein